jgi:hypothetical protein
VENKTNNCSSELKREIPEVKDLFVGGLTQSVETWGLDGTLSGKEVKLNGRRANKEEV